MPSIVRPAKRAEDIRYAVRDIVLVAREAQAAGRELLYLNIGDPNQFDFVTPPHVAEAICRAITDNKTNYAPSEGLPEALTAIRADAERGGIVGIRDAFVGNGASECIEVAFSALVDPGEKVLTPAPGYPLYSAILAKLGCQEVPYYLDEEDGWQPDLDDIAKKIDDKTRAIVLINPNNPTGSVCKSETLKGLVELADRHDLVIFSDEIYNKLVLEGEPISTASLTDQTPILTFNGLSKAYLGPGLRLGWCVTSGDEKRTRPLIDAMHKFLRARLCASHPVQHAVVPALDGDQSHIDVFKAELRKRRDITVEMLNAIDGISCVPPAGAFYAFPRLTNIEGEDEPFIKDLIRATGVVVVHGGGFGQKPGTQHFRVVFLPPVATLKRAFGAIAQFLEARR